MSHINIIVQNYQTVKKAGKLIKFTWYNPNKL